jgi:hypothetical protein
MPDMEEDLILKPEFQNPQGLKTYPVTFADMASVDTGSGKTF